MQGVLVAMHQVAAARVDTGLRLGTPFQQDRQSPLPLVAEEMAALAAEQMTGHREVVRYSERSHPQVGGMVAAVLLEAPCKGTEDRAALAAEALTPPQLVGLATRLQLLRHKEIMAGTTTQVVAVRGALDRPRRLMAQTTEVLA